MRNTKIVATLGPATTTEGVIRDLMLSGVDVFRFNLSHGTHEEHEQRMRLVRRLSAETGRHAGILLDLQGPKIRLGTFREKQVLLRKGESFTITTEQVEGDEHRASASYDRFAADVKPGNRVLIADGSVELKVRAIQGSEVHCDVITGGYVSDRKGINLPGVNVSTPALTRKDMDDLKFGLGVGVDMVALSFVRKRDDVLRLRLMLEQLDANLPIIAKIEKPEAWTNIEDILDESDGVMVARGDLGVEVALEKVPTIQKAIIARARQKGRFVITATQMLESMVTNATPTRAEVSDVANAIEDGTDAVMLSAETSTGKYPVEAVRMMVRIAVEADTDYQRKGYRELPMAERPNPSEIVADAAYRAASTAHPKAVVAFTSSGYTARLVARYRPPVPVHVFTPNEGVIRQLSTVYGVRAELVERSESSDDVFAELDLLLREKVGLRVNDTVVVLAGLPISNSGMTNTMKLHRVGEMS